MYSQTLTAISIFKYVNIVCIIQVHTTSSLVPLLSIRFIAMLNNSMGFGDLLSAVLLSLINA